MSHVAVILTGGTIGQRSDRDGAVPDAGSTLDLVAACCPPGVSFASVQAMERDSPDVSPDDWSHLVEASLAALRDGAAGVVVLHGTDTLAYSAAALSFATAGIDRPIVLTGSMVPGVDECSDAATNLMSAFAVATSALTGVSVVFSSPVEGVTADIMRGAGVLKYRTAGVDAFRSVGRPTLGHVIDGHMHLTGEVPDRPVHARPSGLPVFAHTVDLVKLTPMTSAERLETALAGLAGVVIEGFGAGHVSRHHLPVLRSFAGAVVMTTQVLYDRERLGSYASDRALTEIPNVVRAGPMTSVAALVKLSWALGQGLDVRETMPLNIAGELDGVQFEETEGQETT